MVPIELNLKGRMGKLLENAIRLFDGRQKISRDIASINRFKQDGNSGVLDLTQGVFEIGQKRAAGGFLVHGAGDPRHDVDSLATQNFRIGERFAEGFTKIFLPSGKRCQASFARTEIARWGIQQDHLLSVCSKRRKDFRSWLFVWKQNFDPGRSGTRGRRKTTQERLILKKPGKVSVESRHDVGVVSLGYQ